MKTAYERFSEITGGRLVSVSMPVSTLATMLDLIAPRNDAERKFKEDLMQAVESSLRQKVGEVSGE